MWNLTATEILAKYKDGSLSPVQVMTSVLDRVEQLNSKLNALYDIQPQMAMAQAHASALRWSAGKPKGPLDGIPCVIKDSIEVKGMRMFRGMKARFDVEPSVEDAPPAARMREAGAIIFAKTTMPDMGFLASGVSSYHGVTHNPWGADLNTGGSSAGAGAAIASGMAVLAIGSDVGGSVRLPASHCGIFGLKPTAGIVAHLPYSRDRVVGPLTRSLEDVALLMSVISRPDERAFETGADFPAKIAPLDMSGKNVGLLLNLGVGQAAVPEVAKLIEQAAEVFTTLGAQVSVITTPVDVDFLSDMRTYFCVKASMERDALPIERRRDVLEEINELCDGVANTSAKTYVMAASRFDKAQRQLSKVIDQYDFVLAPTLPMANFGADSIGADPLSPHDHVVFTALTNQSGQPSAVIPCGQVNGAPVGMQLIASKGKDVDILAASISYVQATGFHYEFPIVE